MSDLPDVREVQRPSGRGDGLVGVLLGLLVMAAYESRAASMSGSSLVLRSSGSQSGSSWVLSQDGYVGTYITLAAPATVSLAVTAAGSAGTGTAPQAPQMDIAIDDSKSTFTVGTSSSTYTSNVTLPAGTHFLRIDLKNNTSANRNTLTISNLNVTNATISNSNTNANAIAAANTYPRPSCSLSPIIKPTASPKPRPSTTTSSPPIPTTSTPSISSPNSPPPPAIPPPLLS